MSDSLAPCNELEAKMRALVDQLDSIVSGYIQRVTSEADREDPVKMYDVYQWGEDACLLIAEKLRREKLRCDMVTVFTEMSPESDEEDDDEEVEDGDPSNGGKEPQPS